MCFTFDRRTSSDWLFEDEDGDTIGVDGTLRWCTDLGVDPEDVSLLAIAYELKSPTVGEWAKSGFIEGWKRLGYVSAVLYLRISHTPQTD